MSFPMHAAYRKSGVDWLGEVPGHWELRRLKYVVSLLADKGHERENTVGLENIEGWNGRFIPTDAKFEGAGVDFAAGDVLFGKLRPYLAKVWLAEFDGEAVGDFHVMRPASDICGRYLVYQMLNRDFISIVNGSTFGAKMPRAGWDFMANIAMPLPPLNEQKAIATFLDRETAKIDALVAEQRRLIALLKEKRQAVISHAVTKGLNPDAPMKPSGIEWLGDVPEHWEVGPVKRFLHSLDGRRVPLSSEERSYRRGVYPYYGASGIIDWVDDFLFDDDLILVSEDGANLLNRTSPIAFVATGRYWVNNHAHILLPSDDCLHYWAERLEAIDLAPFVTGAAQPKLTIEALMNLRIAVPPTDTERRETQQYVSEKATMLDELQLESVHAIALLQERRTALISAAVTGKIDVREIVEKGVA